MAKFNLPPADKPFEHWNLALLNAAFSSPLWRI
jgi:hypothetical protein